jgi:hypothetical protein
MKFSSLSWANPDDVMGKSLPAKLRSIQLIAVQGGLMMANQENLSTNQSVRPEVSLTSRIQALGFVLGMSGLMVFPYVSLSLWMTSSTWADLGTIRQAIALLIPLISGILAIAFPQSMKAVMDRISQVFEILPF